MKLIGLMSALCVLTAAPRIASAQDDPQTRKSKVPESRPDSRDAKGAESRGVDSRRTPDRETSGNLAETALQAGSLKMFVAAAEAAGLVDVLKGTDSYTVFAPTDEAFAKLPPEMLAGLMKPENKVRLAQIVRNHFVVGRLPAIDAAKLEFVTTLHGSALRLKGTTAGEGTTLMVDGARVTKADLNASNGIVHLVDAVLLPLANLVETARAAGSFKMLLAAAEAGGLLPTLAGKEPLTIFAPTDEAFAKLPSGMIENLLKTEGREKLAAFVSYHVVRGRLLASDVAGMSALKTLNGREARVTATSDGVKIDAANVVRSDVLAGNGVIHVIDSVLMP